AIAAMVQRACADRRVGVAQAAEAVLVVAEEIRVDRPDADTLLLGEASQLPVVVDGVPRDVESDTWTASGEAVDERGVGDPLVHRTSGPRPRVDVKARPRIAVAPGRGLDLESPQPVEEVLLRHGASLTHRRSITKLLSVLIVS